MSYPFDERRLAPRKSGHDLYLEHVAEINAKNLVIAQQQDQIDTLLLKVERYQQAIVEACVGIAKAHKIDSPSVMLHMREEVDSEC